MTALVQIFNAAGLPVTSGVTVSSSSWSDGGSGTPTVASPAHVVDGVWRLTVTDPTNPRGDAGVVLAYDDGIETVEAFVLVKDPAFLGAGSAATKAANRLGGGNPTRNATTGLKTFKHPDGTTSFTESAEDVESGTGTVTRT